MLQQKEFNILSVIEENNKKLSQRELAKLTNLSIGTVNSTIAKLEEKYIFYTKKNIEAVVIEELDNYFQCVTYHYEVSNALPDLKSALAFCIPYWGIDYDYPVERFDKFEEAKKYALERVKLLNWDYNEISWFRIKFSNFMCFTKVFT